PVTFSGAGPPSMTSRRSPADDWIRCATARPAASSPRKEWPTPTRATRRGRQAGLGRRARVQESMRGAVIEHLLDVGFSSVKTDETAGLKTGQLPLIRRHFQTVEAAAGHALPTKGAAPHVKADHKALGLLV